MGPKTKRSSIERRFILSILWVGVIPMTLALVIGYFAAREGQQIVVMRNLLTTAQKTAGAMRLLVEERERVAHRTAQLPVIVSYLRACDRGENPDKTPVVQHFAYESDASELLESQFYLFDSEGVPLLYPESAVPPDKIPAKDLSREGFIGLDYVIGQGRYDAELQTPIKDPGTGKLLGYLRETQSIHDLLELILEDQKRPNYEQRNRYEVVFFSDSMRFAVKLGKSQETKAPPPTIRDVPPGLEERLARNINKPEDAFFLWSYPSEGISLPVLMAYRRLSERFPVYVVVHQPAPGVFFGINLAFGASLLGSIVIIGIFCAIAYRIVNNSIIRPVSLLNEGAQIIRQGNFDLKLRIQTGDEIEELATSFNQMATALRTNMRHLKESEEKYRHLVTSMRDGLFQTDAKDRITFVNPAGASIMGYDDFSDILGKKLVSFFANPEEYDRISEAIQHSPYIENVRIWLKRPDGEEACVEFSGSRIFDEEGMFRGMDGTFRDVTRNVKLEREVRERAERIAAINQIANVVNSSVEAGLVYENLAREVRHLAEFDYAAVSLRLSDGTFETRQLWPEPSGGREMFPRMDDDNSCAGWVGQERRYLLIENLQAATIPVRYQFPAQIRSILCVPLYVADDIAGALSFGSEKVGGFTLHHAQIFEQMAPHLAAAIRNAQLLENLKLSLDEVNQAREKLHAANLELKSLDEMKTHLLSNVSHELRTPLVAVMGYTDMILNKKAGPITELQQEYLEITMRNVEKLVTLIENLLDFAKLYRGAEEMLFTQFDVIDCVLSSMQTVRPVADGRSIRLHLKIHDAVDAPVSPPITIEGDKGRLGQVFNNLLANAVKFNHNGGSVTVDVEVRKEDVRFSVIDTGIGIPKEAQDKVFNRFYQYDSSSTRKYGGTGIGLSIAQDIVRLHGGRITVSSEDGKGTTFRFTLPLYKQPQSSEDTARPPLPIETHQLVQLVSQDRALCVQVRQALLSEGMDIIHAAYPAAAASLAQKYNPDCLIVDTESGPVGTMLLEELFRESIPLNLPVVILTDDERLFQAFRDRVAARVKRNFRKSTLLSGIHYALSQKNEKPAVLGGKILYVDDDEETCLFLKRCLDPDGYLMEYCHSGEEALKLVGEGQYWMVLLEIALPGADGWEICRKIKSNARLTGIKVYIVTAKANEQQSAEIHNSGSDGLLLKPFKAEEILSVVRAFDTHRQ